MKNGDNLLTLAKSNNAGDMDTQADIKWIQRELSKARDPDLIAVSKRLLQFRKKNIAATIQEYNDDIAEAVASTAGLPKQPKKNIRWINTSQKTTEITGPTGYSITGFHTVSQIRRYTSSG